MDGVARNEAARGQVAADRAVQHVGLAGDQADGLFLALVILQAERLPRSDVDDLADILAFQAGVDRFVSPGLGLLLRAIQLGSRLCSHRCAARRVSFHGVLRMVVRPSPEVEPYPNSGNRSAS